MRHPHVNTGYSSYYIGLVLAQANRVSHAQARRLGIMSRTVRRHSWLLPTVPRVVEAPPDDVAPPLLALTVMRTSIVESCGKQGNNAQMQRMAPILPPMQTDSLCRAVDVLHSDATASLDPDHEP